MYKNNSRTALLTRNVKEQSKGSTVVQEQFKGSTVVQKKLKDSAAVQKQLKDNTGVQEQIKDSTVVQEQFKVSIQFQDNSRTSKTGGHPDPSTKYQVSLAFLYKCNIFDAQIQSTSTIRQGFRFGFWL